MKFIPSQFFKGIILGAIIVSPILVLSTPQITCADDHTCHTSHPTPTPTIDQSHNDCDKDGDYYTDKTESRECITPTPSEVPPTPTETATPSATPTPGNDNNSSSTGNPGNSSTNSSTNSPAVCPELPTDEVPANFHIYRNGPLALAKWVPDTQFPEVIIWYGHNGKGQEYAYVFSNTGYQFIDVYDFGDYTFWASYKNGCEVGKQTKAPVIDNATNTWHLFRQF